MYSLYDAWFNVFDDDGATRYRSGKTAAVRRHTKYTRVTVKDEINGPSTMTSVSTVVDGHY